MKNNIVLYLLLTIILLPGACTDSRELTASGHFRTVGNMPFQEKVLVTDEGSVYFIRPDVTKKYTIKTGHIVDIICRYQTIKLRTADKKHTQTKNMIIEISELVYR